MKRLVAVWLAGVMLLALELTVMSLARSHATAGATQAAAPSAASMD